MSFQDIKIKHEYRSFQDDIVTDFYIPLLKKSVMYDRAVGYFSSTSLIEISEGIEHIAIKKGKIRIITSPMLSKEDLMAINKGHKARDGVIEKSLMSSLINPENNYDKSRLNLLANLIADDILDIKVVVVNNENSMGIYHEKLGILEDLEGNKIVFTGSMNETLSGFKLNYESVDVFSSLNGDNNRINSKIKHFDDIWNNRNKTLVSIEIPKIKKYMIDKYKSSELSYQDFVKSNSKSWIKKPEYIKGLFDYQKEAIQKWKENNFRGIFDMATGTGKTLTALGALSVLEKELNSNLGVIVICPYQHLVEQWVEDIEASGVSPLICYSSYNWKNEFESIITDFNLGIIDNFFIVTTNMTFTTEYFQNNIDRLSGNVCLVVDEAHNFGTKRQISTMKEVYKYRLALSATIERYGDEQGTKKLYDFFGKKCIEYNLEEAIRDGRLTRYFYYPIPISLTDYEREQYDELSGRIGRAISMRNKEDDPTETEKMLLIRRSRIIAGAANKIPALCEIINSIYKEDNHMLIYCGSANSTNYNYIEGKPENEEKRQIDIVLDKLGNDLGMRVAKFTSEENSKEREVIKESFKEGSLIQALVAIRCLDEGVNIPSIKTAFILASSTNPKEYIQRRGRVLRLHDGKDYATIYDFITLPEDIDNITGKYNVSEYELNLIEREFMRVKEFARLSENPMDSYEIEKILAENYELYYREDGHYEE